MSINLKNILQLATTRKPTVSFYLKSAWLLISNSALQSVSVKFAGKLSKFCGLSFITISTFTSGAIEVDEARETVGHIALVRKMDSCQKISLSDGASRRISRISVISEVSQFVSFRAFQVK